MSTLTLNLDNKEQLFAAYMPFIKNGGLFVTTHKNYSLGEEITVSLTLMNEAPEFITGKVIWITPSYAQCNRPAGVGMQLNDELCKKIEGYLIDMLPSEKETDTL